MQFGNKLQYAVVDYGGASSGYGYSNMDSSNSSSTSGTAWYNTVFSNLGSYANGAASIIAATKGQSNAPTTNVYNPTNASSNNMIWIVVVIVVVLLLVFMLFRPKTA